MYQEKITDCAQAEVGVTRSPETFDQNFYRAAISQLAAARGLTSELSVTAMSFAAAENEAASEDLQAEFSALVKQLDEKLAVLIGDGLVNDMSSAHANRIREFVAARPNCERILRALEASVLSMHKQIQRSDEVSYTEAREFHFKNWPAVRDEITNVIWDVWIEHDKQRDVALDGMKTLSETLTTTLDDIKRISMTVRMISLNAAVLASRAGEKGAGFTVIATEVRSLAEKIQSSANRAYNVLKEVDFSR